MVSNHKVIIADEATSSLDNFSDLDIQRTILNLPNTTKIIITHRMNKEILEEVDDIIVMNNGQIVESGDYNVLYNKKGLFYSLYNINNAGTINKENDSSTKETREAFTC